MLQKLQKLKKQPWAGSSSPEGKADNDYKYDDYPEPWVCEQLPERRIGHFSKKGFQGDFKPTVYLEP